MYCSLHTHSHYSLLDGLAKIPDLVNRAKEIKMPALALTDHGVMYGTIEFYKTCQENNIKPIIGCEIYVAPRSHLKKEFGIDNKYNHMTLLAKNDQGYKNLTKLVSIAHLEGFYYKPRVDKKTIRKYAEGIIALSGCPAGILSQMSKKDKLEKISETALEWQKIFGQGNFYIEIQPHEQISEIKKMNQVLRKVSQVTKIPLVITTDSHYCLKNDQDAHEILLKINTASTSKEDSGMSLKDFHLHLHSDKEIRKLMPNDSEAIDNSEKIADKIDFKFKFGEYILPAFPLPANETDSFDYMKKLVYQGFKKRYKKNNIEARKQVEYELEVIKKTGYTDYFLIVSDMINWAKNQGIMVGPGRGSAAGSIVSYCLNITSLNPLDFGLIFERFLNPERISMPDIDVDYADDRRHEVINYLVRKYGTDRVAQIITFGIMKSRMVVRDVTRALDYPYAIGDQIAKSIPMGMALELALKSSSDLLGLYNSNPDVKKVIDMALKLENVARHASTHAAGVVISKEPLVNYLPLQRSTGSNDIASTQFSMYDVETIGLLKLDVLGLKNLTIIKNTTRIINKVYGKIVDIDNLPLDDKKTFELFKKGNTVGVFQLESEGMRRYIKELQPTKIDDIMAMVALYRPGPMEFIPDYIRGKIGGKKPKYLHPKLKPILENTYGIAVYQEQILQIARDIAGFSYGEADVLRKAIGKKIKKLLQEQRKKFVKGAIEFSQIDKNLAEKLFDFAEPFARYGFNRAHAACYAMIAYQTAYLKANYPAAFLAALLTSEQKDLDKIAIAVNEAEKQNIKVLPPNINESFPEFAIVKTGKKETIRYGLMAIKNVGVKVAEIITQERIKNGVYKDLKDFIKRLPTNVLNKKSLEALTFSGAFDSFAERNQIFESMDEILNFVKAKSRASKQPDLFGSTNTKVEDSPFELKNVEPANKRKILTWEKEFLGIYLTEHPLQEHISYLKNLPLNTASLNERLINKEVYLAGILTECKKIITKNNANMMFCRLEDLVSSVELIIFPRILENYQSLLMPDSLVGVKGKVNLKDGEIKILVDEVEEINQQKIGAEIVKKFQANQTNQIIVTIPRNSKKSLLEKIKNILESNPGNCNVILKIPVNGNYFEKKLKTRVKPNTNLFQELKEIVGSNNLSI
ncbi:DNA polymerase III subunit alpha [Candidatus Berkelbacteria bacterium CG10_big_fil_rev_8_21_14_0_10_33_10]|uniref:DNA polymerase III subunit alpha n=1 Tax=Candidatus Berkelbacteria bacterium CG_4_10_14_0_2_um_filter_35_9_33_12 TaxID=1974499 RepID=A0A2M7W3R4_9BACT|nr:MAG: DNA polymerase III subunit alpha [Candidatus Berkelbacteria bacterium CG23_combo_of_CG06-09_8_20_14_all_33_15]PIS08282.1 MAG: DNA polymerase III subunit alpha [Candidatus Berkelbacteria bacterium CG10_big_fil_rev_8_21_14_0_10_33_10]PJA20224.1 MAG: DNA polymerase III subunit alpha [Candidatus Berkelbacteria bacterium CG_4_10_14_0_2_um_filter_35_9_33_12]